MAAVGFITAGLAMGGGARGHEAAGAIKDLPRAKESLFLNIPYDPSFSKLYLAYIAGVSSFGLAPRATLEYPECIILSAAKDLCSCSYFVG